ALPICTRTSRAASPSKPGRPTVPSGSRPGTWTEAAICGLRRLSFVGFERGQHMTDERLQILRMVEQGKVSAEEAVKLLEALGDDSSAQPARARRSNRMMRVRVIEGERTKINVNLPLQLARVALGFVPKDALRGSVGGEHLDGDASMRMLEEGLEGKIVDVEDEDTKVEVIVE